MYTDFFFSCVMIVSLQISSIQSQHWKPLPCSKNSMTDSLTETLSSELSIRRKDRSVLFVPNSIIYVTLYFKFHGKLIKATIILLLITCKSVDYGMFGRLI